MATESKKLQTIEGFTPGPWVVEGHADQSSQISIEQVGGQRKYVALVDAQGVGYEQQANANLIAAAPDLYRIAHEQRPVFLRLSVALNLCLEALEDGTPEEQVSAELEAREALAAAVPFLED